MPYFGSFPGPILWAYFYILPVGSLFRADAVRLPHGDGLVGRALPHIGGWRALVVCVERQAVQIWRFHPASGETATLHSDKPEKHEFADGGGDQAAAQSERHQLILGRQEGAVLGTGVVHVLNQEEVGQALGQRSETALATEGRGMGESVG